MPNIEWTYLQELPETGTSPPTSLGAEIHCEFLLRFAAIPPGEGHCAFFGVNIVGPAEAARLGLPPGGGRGYLVADHLTRDEFKDFVSTHVEVAFGAYSHPEALALLDQTFIWHDRDFRAGFISDVISAENLAHLIKQTFDNVVLEDGISLHQALARDDYASAEEFKAARALDTDQHWRDVPPDTLATCSQIFSFLDAKGYRYYLPAAMILSLDPKRRQESDTPRYAYWSLLPRVAPRHSGKGLGAAFDVGEFINTYGLDATQVRTLYRYLCFMAITAGEGIDEDQYPAFCRWREKALEVP